VSFHSRFSRYDNKISTCRQQERKTGRLNEREEERKTEQRKGKRKEGRETEVK
jgi:hypothetical protein